MQSPILSLIFVGAFSFSVVAEDAPAKTETPAPAPVAQSPKFQGAMGEMKVEVVQVQPTILFRVLMKPDVADGVPDPAHKKSPGMNPISSLSLKPDEVPTAVTLIQAFLKMALAARQEKARAFGKTLGTLDGKEIGFTWMPWTGRAAIMNGDSLIFEEDALEILKLLKTLAAPKPDSAPAP
jgi:hypothetical protein